MSRHTTPTATPSPRSEQLHTMSNHTKNDIRAHTDRHTIANDPGNLHAMSNHTQNDTKGAHRPPHHHQRPGNLHAMSIHTKNHTHGAHTNRNTINPQGFRIFPPLSRG